MTEEDYKKQLQKAEKIGKTIQYKREIAAAKNTKKCETSKILALYLFALLSVIIIYAMVAMWKFADLSYLGVLISDIAAQILIYGIYCMKAYKAKKSEEELKYKREHSAEELLIAGSESKEPVPITDRSVPLFGNDTVLEEM